MKKTFALLAATALLGACAKDIDPEDVREAMPQASVVQVGTAMSSEPGALMAPAGVPAEFAASSYWIAATFNVATWWTLTLLQVITSLPPTECGPDTCTWGPWTDDRTHVTWRLVVTKDGDGYEYVLASHAAAASEFTPILTGTAFPGASRYRGYGAFTIDFDAARAVNPADDDYGQLSVNYDNRAALHVDALFLGAENEDPGSDAFLDIAYDFDRTATGGELQIMFEGVTTSDNLSLRTRWLEGGHGRGDARYVTGEGSFQQTQCWADQTADWVLEYQELQAGTNEPIVLVGTADACAPFTSAVYSDLTLP